MAFPSKQSITTVSAKAQQAAALLKKEKKEIAVGPKTKAAIELMVFEGKKRKEAAEEIGMSDETLRQSLLKPHVLAFVNQCQEVLRTSLRPRALHTMGDLLDSKNDSTKFKAAEYLDGMNRSSHQVGATVNVQVNNTVNVTPGYVLDLRPEDYVKADVQIEHLEQDEVIELDALVDVPNEE